MPKDYSGGYDKYPIISDSELPEEVRDELCNECPSNDSGRILWPDFHPKFEAWLKSEGLEVKPYIIWFSW